MIRATSRVIEHIRKVWRGNIGGKGQLFLDQTLGGGGRGFFCIAATLLKPYLDPDPLATVTLFTIPHFLTHTHSPHRCHSAHRCPPFVDAPNPQLMCVLPLTRSVTILSASLDLIC